MSEEEANEYGVSVEAWVDLYTNEMWDVLMDEDSGYPYYIQVRLSITTPPHVYIAWYVCV